MENRKAAEGVAGTIAGLMAMLALLALIGWWLMWPGWEGPPPAALPPPLTLILLGLASLSLLARARGRPAGWSSAPALLLMVLAAILVLEASASLRGGLAHLFSPATTTGASLRDWRPSVPMAGQAMLLGAALWSVHGRRSPGLDLGDVIAAGALAAALVLLVLQPGLGAGAALLLSAALLALQGQRGLLRMLRGMRLPAKRVRKPIESDAAADAPGDDDARMPEPAATPVPALQASPAAQARPRIPVAQAPPPVVDSASGLLTEAGWNQRLREEDAQCEVSGVSGCVIVFEPKPTDNAAALDAVPAVLRGAARKGDAIARLDGDYFYLAAGCPSAEALPLLAELRTALARSGVQVWMGIAMRDLNPDFPSAARVALSSKNALRAGSTGAHAARR